MNAPDRTAGMRCWQVTIEFKDGAYQNNVHAYTKERAIELAVQDARMASANPVHQGVITGKFATEVK